MLHHQGINAAMWHSVLHRQVVPSHKVRGAARHCRAGGEGDAKRLADRGGNIMSRFNWQ